jgi:hypothetical protein
MQAVILNRRMEMILGCADGRDQLPRPEQM